MRLLPEEVSRDGDGDGEAAETLTEEQVAVFSAIEKAPVHIDQVISRSFLVPAKVSAILLDLELKGLIIQLPGKWFVRA